jgi:hypothetical protein
MSKDFEMMKRGAIDTIRARQLSHEAWVAKAEIQEGPDLVEIGIRKLIIDDLKQLEKQIKDIDYDDFVVAHVN